MSDENALHPNGRCECFGEGQCEWCVRTMTEDERLVLVCGSRSGHVTIADAWWLKGVLEGVGATGVIHGDCEHAKCDVPGGCGRPSIDRWSGEIAKRCGLKEFPVAARWKDFGPAAGPMRNAIMLCAPVILTVAWPSAGPGTRDMRGKSARANVRVLQRSP